MRNHSGEKLKHNGLNKRVLYFSPLHKVASVLNSTKRMSEWSRSYCILNMYINEGDSLAGLFPHKNHAVPTYGPHISFRLNGERKNRLSLESVHKPLSRSQLLYGSSDAASSTMIIILSLIDYACRLFIYLMSTPAIT